MGTNYYYDRSDQPDPCPHCGRRAEGIHVGKKSAGWRFILRATDEKDTWERMKERLRKASRIFDEYGRDISFGEIVQIVENKDGKSHAGQCPSNECWEDKDGYAMWSCEFS